MNGKIDYRCGNHRVVCFGRKKILNFAYNFEFDIFALEPSLFGFGSALNRICQVFSSDLPNYWDWRVVFVFSSWRAIQFIILRRPLKLPPTEVDFSHRSWFPARSRNIGGTSTQKTTRVNYVYDFLITKILCFGCQAYTSSESSMSSAQNGKLPPVRKERKKYKKLNQMSPSQRVETCMKSRLEGWRQFWWCFLHKAVSRLYQTASHADLSIFHVASSHPTAFGVESAFTITSPLIQTPNEFEIRVCLALIHHLI